LDQIRLNLMQGESCSVHHCGSAVLWRTVLLATSATSPRRLPRLILGHPQEQCISPYLPLINRLPAQSPAHGPAP
jgi:hypothetical protein